MIWWKLVIAEQQRRIFNSVDVCVELEELEELEELDDSEGMEELEDCDVDDSD